MKIVTTVNYCCGCGERGRHFIYLNPNSYLCPQCVKNARRLISEHSVSGVKTLEDIKDNNGF